MCCCDVGLDVSGRTTSTTANDHFVRLNEQIQRHSMGKWMIPVATFKSPESSYRARVSLPEDVRRLMQSFASTSSVHGTSVVVAFWPDSESLPSSATFNLSQVDVLDRCKSDGFYFIVGDHTQQAVKLLHGKFPRNKLWQTVEAEVLICHRSTESYQMLKSWGILDNIKGQARTVVSFEQRMLSLREDFTNWKKDTEGLPTKDVSAVLAGVKANRQLEYQMNANSFGQLWNLASRSEGVWSRLEKIFTGQVASSGRSKPKKPKSASNFTQMGGIPDVDLIKLLDDVVVNGKALKDFTKACRFYKAVVRVQTSILTHESISLEDWAQAQSKFPCSCADDFVQQWANTIVASRVGARAPLPAAFWQALGRRVETDLRVQDSRAALSAVCFH